MKYLDLKADLTFKKIFGNHPDRLRNLLYDRYQKGREEGMNQRSLEIARNMLAKGMAASTVLEITGLSMEEIQ